MASVLKSSIAAARFRAAQSLSQEFRPPVFPKVSAPARQRSGVPEAPFNTRARTFVAWESRSTSACLERGSFSALESATRIHSSLDHIGNQMFRFPENTIAKIRSSPRELAMADSKSSETSMPQELKRSLFVTASAIHR